MRKMQGIYSVFSKRYSGRHAAMMRENELNYDPAEVTVFAFPSGQKVRLTQL